MSGHARTVAAVIAGFVAGGTTVAFTRSGSESPGSKSAPSFFETKKDPPQPYAHSGLKVNKVLASYTTNFEPSQKWDENWDRYMVIYFSYSHE